MKVHIFQGWEVNDLLKTPEWPKFGDLLGHMVDFYAVYSMLSMVSETGIPMRSGGCPMSTSF